MESKVSMYVGDIQTSGDRLGGGDDCSPSRANLWLIGSPVKVKGPVSLVVYPLFLSCVGRGGRMQQLMPGSQEW